MTTGLVKIQGRLRWIGWASAAGPPRAAKLWSGSPLRSGVERARGAAVHQAGSAAAPAPGAAPASPSRSWIR